MGAVMSNDLDNITDLDHLTGRTIDIPCVYLCDDDIVQSAQYAVRITNVPPEHFDSLIVARPYILYQDADNNEFIYYGTEQFASVNGVNARMM